MKRKGNIGPKNGAGKTISAAQPALRQPGEEWVSPLSEMAAAEAADKPPPHEPGPRYLRLWELPQNLRCPVVGTCIRDRELRKILTKSGFRAKQYSSFQLHVQVMNRMEDENPISRKVDAALRRKFRESIAEFGEMAEDDFLSLWRERLNGGETDFVDLFYVSSIRTDFSDGAAMEIYGDIHMMGHAQTRKAVSAGQKLAEERQRADQAEARWQKERERSQCLKEKNQALNAELREAHARITELSFSNACLRKCQDSRKRETPAPLSPCPAEELGRLKTENRQMGKELKRVEREKRKLQIELFELRTLRDQLSGEIETLVARFGEMAGCGGATPPLECREQDCATCSKRILIVGGMTRIRHLYQALVESRGGVFDYHDGYMQNGNRDIDAQVRRSDIVICPVNCNSHGACRKIKHLCKKYEKPFKMLSSASLSAITEALGSDN
ncbi:MAG: DUF2325 domain-containing protein [Desulfococcaceae bacterium]